MIPAPPSTSAPAESTAPRLLVVEDHADSREALLALLEAVGYTVYAARNGREGIEMALQVRPDLILMDIMMPEVDGFEAARTLRASEEFPQVPIIALTAMEGARELTLAAGFDDYIAKPIEVRVFLGKAQDWLERGHQQIP